MMLRMKITASTSAAWHLKAQKRWRQMAAAIEVLHERDEELTLLRLVPGCCGTSSKPEGDWDDLVSFFEKKTQITVLLRCFLERWPRNLSSLAASAVISPNRESAKSWPTYGDPGAPKGSIDGHSETR